MPTKPLDAYKKTEQQTVSGRHLEARVLTKCALALKECQENWDTWEPEDRDSRLDAALKYNQLIWSVFQGELARDDNPMPREIRENLLNLSIFIDKRILEVRAFPDPAKLNPIIDINLNIAAGLKETSADQAEQAGE
jgi:flagellar protein FlaF